MSELARWALAGYGNIGQELAAQISDKPSALGLRQQPEYVERSTGVYGPDAVTLLEGPHPKNFSAPDVLFVAVPTTADGEPETGLILDALKAGSMVVTAAKGALANNHAEILRASDGGRRFGGSAAVGGGTGMVDELAPYVGRYDLNEVHLSLNGTLADISSSQDSFDRAVQSAIDRGLAEPGSTSPHDVVRGELTDIALKTAIVFNSLGLGGEQPLDWRRMQSTLTDDQIKLAAHMHQRFLVSLYPPTHVPRIGDNLESVTGGFDIIENDWRIVGGYMRLGQNAVRAALENSSGPNVGFAVGMGPYNEHGAYSLVGPGAGPMPTVSTMLGDWMRLRQAS